MSGSSNALDRLLATGNRAAETSATYRAFVDSGGRPQGGFSITHANGDMDGFLYQRLGNLGFRARNGQEFLSFTHHEVAVTMQGTGLRLLMKALTRQTLMEIHEQDGRPVEQGQPVIMRLEVTFVGQT